MSDNTNGFDSGDTTLYEILGGKDVCQRLASAFYGRVPHDPILRPIFPGSFHCAIPTFAVFLAQIVGGPNEYSEQRYWLSMREAHARFKIGQAERDAWYQNMLLAIDEVKIEEPARSILRAFFEETSTQLINCPPGAGEAAAKCPHEVLARQWGAQTTVDDIVDAVRHGEAARALEMMEDVSFQAYLGQDGAAYVSLLALLGCHGDAALFDYIHQCLTREPGLATGRHYHGSTSLHAAASAGNLPFVELLLELGADGNAADLYGHTPLYSAGNGQGTPDVIRALVRAGADVDVADQVKQCTALHMAARRGNVPVAEALLDCGADIESRDRNGETPLRRAVNCGKSEAAAFLLSRGADAHSVGSKGLTPMQAARGAAMKAILEPYAGTNLT